MTADRGPIDALRSIHAELWDPARGLDRLAPGVAPGIDLTSLDLHPTRESALGALLDLDDGATDRAVTSLRNVLACQYPTSSHPWSGTFPVTAEQPEPPADDAVEWLHYDPNWRQFLGCIIAVTDTLHALPDPLRREIDAALQRCVHGEPVDRIARWYTNPNLMHAWLAGHVARRTGDDSLAAAAGGRRDRIVERFERYGDLDEYNSPTYDGIDLMALGLWAAFPPTPEYDRAGRSMIAAVGDRVSRLHHPGVGAGCGPYIRAYGIVPTTYVSMWGLWFAVAGRPPGDVLPWPVDADTVHVHDLYFVALLRHLASVVTPHLRWAPVDDERHHVQEFRHARAESLLRPRLAVGWERGRRHEASLDQYVPFTAHVAEPDGVAALGVMVPGETAWIDVERAGDLRFAVRATGRDASVGVRLVVHGDVVRSADTLEVGADPGAITVRFDRPPESVEDTMAAAGRQLHVTWPEAEATVEITVAPTS